MPLHTHSYTAVISYHKALRSIYECFGERDMTAVFLSNNAKTLIDMNEFEKQRNALRTQFKTEQRQITKDCYRTIGHLNTAIGKVNSPEAREALRAEKERVHDYMLRSHELNKTCYLQQLDLIDEEYSQHLKLHPSKTRFRSILAAFCKSAEAEGNKSISIHFGKDRVAKISFE